MIAVTVWNAVIFDERNGNTNYVEKTRNLITSSSKPFLKQFDDLIKRKRTKFAEDHRLIGKFEVYNDEGGEFRVRATAHKAPERSPDSKFLTN